MRSLFIAAALFLTACASAPGAADAEAGTAPETQPIVIGESRQIASEFLSETRTYNVWLPPSYAEGEMSYPVVYLVDGGVDQDFHHITGLAHLASMWGMFRDVIVVGVETKDRRAELTAPSSDPSEIADFPTHGQAAKFRAFLRNEVMPDVEARYRTNGEEALIGESLAGLFIMETFLTEPDTVDAYIAISPSLWWDRASRAKKAASDMRLFPRAERKLYIAIADEGGLMREGVLDIVKALKSEKVPGLRWTFSDRPDLTHATIYHREALDALIWIFGENKKPSE